MLKIAVDNYIDLDFIAMTDRLMVDLIYDHCWFKNGYHQGSKFKDNQNSKFVQIKSHNDYWYSIADKLVVYYNC